ncbi:type VII toxin-antitoxin system MntA family adenylyltransferase antitoxin [Halovenus halobia]|uniref:type VII toxin-antitoxin system MntA family adenylyltransferase antitoxin n=1 Tax=Halovenus halobia TaxID=3396622 RepID=UPI003F56A00D
MGVTDGFSRLITMVKESLCHDEEVEFTVLFGSQVAGEPRSASDLDVAVKFTDDLSSHERFQKRCFLAGNLQQDNAPFVDLSDIEALPLAVAHDAITGELLCGDEQAFRQYKAEIEAAFDQQREDIHRHQRDVIDRMAEGGLRG